MRHLPIVILLLMFVLVPYISSASEQVQPIDIFYSQRDHLGWKAVVKGSVMSFAAREEYGKTGDLPDLQEKTSVTVRLKDSSGIKPGDTLFVINNRNLVVSRIKVWNIFPSASFGAMMTGYGNFRLASIGDRVVIRHEDALAADAPIFKSRGDHYVEVEDSGKAISEYKKAIERDRTNPEAHMGLGTVYHRQEIYPMAMSEYLIAYGEKSRIKDNEEKFILLKNMADVRFREVFYSNIEPALRKKYRAEGMRYCREALEIYSGSAEVNYLMGRFVYEPSTTPQDSDRTARDYFLKTIELQPDHADANAVLSELYFKYKNTKKARNYATRALETDPSNERARQIIRYIDTGFNRR